MGALATNLDSRVMVSPIGKDSRVIGPDVQEDLFAYAYSGVLLSRGVTLKQAEQIPFVEAEIVSEFEVWTCGDRPSEPTQHPAERFRFSRVISNRRMFFRPSGNDVINVLFTDQTGQQSLYIEVCARGPRPTSSVQVKDIMSADVQLGFFLRSKGTVAVPRIINLESSGRRGLLLDGRSQHAVIPLPELSIGQKEASRSFLEALSAGRYDAIPLEQFVMT